MLKKLKSLVKSKMAGGENEKNRLKWLEKALLEIPEGQRILDAGAGELKQKKFCKHLEYVSHDFGKYDGFGDNKGLQWEKWDNTKLDIVSDITEIPEPDASFDAIMCVEVFEHIPSPISAIKEFSRLLKNGGYLVLTAPFASLTHFSPYHFYSGFNKYFYIKHLEENGFEIINIEANGNYFEYLAQELRRLKSVSKLYAKKKITFIDKIVVLYLTFRLKKISLKDSNSQELLNFGFHIYAKKK